MLRRCYSIDAMATTPEPQFVLRCDTCGRAYYDEQYRNENCRECGSVLQ
jgi:rRNA maturation endonuclease Nob1